VLGIHALARDDEIPGGVGKTFPRSFDLFENGDLRIAG